MLRAMAGTRVARVVRRNRAARARRRKKPVAKAVAQRHVSPSRRTAQLCQNSSYVEECIVTQTKIDSARDVVSFLVAPHEQVKSLLQNVPAASGKQREQAFLELRRMLPGH